MKILMMARNLVTELSAPRYVLELSKEFINLGHEVIIPTSNPKKPVEGAKIVKLPKFFGNRMVAPLFYSSYAKYAKYRKQVDIIHGNGYSLFDDVTTVHFMSRSYKERSKQYAGKSKSDSSLTEYIQKKILKSSKHLIAVSNLVKNDLINYYDIPEDKITTIHNGVNLKEFSPSNGTEKNELIKKHNLNTDTKILLFIGGSAYERKGFGFLLDALPFMSRDVVVMATCKNLSDTYSKRMKDPEISGRIIVENFVPNVSELYKAADIYILPTIYDPFPLAVLEAMGSNLPIIISSNCGCIDIIKNEVNGIILDDLTDKENFAKTINRLAGDSDLRQRLGKNARDTVLNLSWNDVAKKNLELYHRVIKSND